MDPHIKKKKSLSTLNFFLYLHKIVYNQTILSLY